MKARFIDVINEPDKGEALRRAAGGAASSNIYSIDPEEFRDIPGSPFAYRISPDVRNKFHELAPFESQGRLVRAGLQTNDDGRFVRLWWEPGPSFAGRWKSYAKGGATVGFYADLKTIVNWDCQGAELKAFAETTSGTTHWSRHCRSSELYFRPGITWPLRASKFSPRPMPSMSIFSVRGYSVFAPEKELLQTLGMMLSAPVDALFKVCLGRANHPEFVTGVLKRLPWPEIDRGSADQLARLAGMGWSLRRSLDTVFEASHAFTVPALLKAEGSSFGARVETWTAWVAGVEAELRRLQSQVDELGFGLYGISEKDRLAIEEGHRIISDGDQEGDSGAPDDADDDGSEVVELDPAGLAAGLVSWAVGVAVGRFDLRLATGERAWPEEPDPFDPLPTCSPGMLGGDDGRPHVTTPPAYGVEVSQVLVNDPGHKLDITARVRAVFDAVFGENADGWWSDVGFALGAKGGEVGDWLHKGFFDHHLKTYSGSRREAPILWPIGTRSGSYVVWLYAHRASADALFQVLNDVVVPKLTVEQRDLAQLRQEAGANPTPSQRKASDAQERFVAELREFREELEAVAPLWAPDLSDGIVTMLAPLWRLFSHHRVWSSQLKKHWVKLAKGNYDWAQVSMRLWPERVVPKCATDRSLAIAHSLEDVFWVQEPGNKDKRLPREVPSTPIDELIAQRHSPATIAAVQRVNT
jgi:hypothetical protein